MDFFIHLFILGMGSHDYGDQDDSSWRTRKAGRMIQADVKALRGWMSQREEILPSSAFWFYSSLQHSG